MTALNDIAAERRHGPRLGRSVRQRSGARSMTALSDIAAERRRQIEVEGFTPNRDDGYADGCLAQAAACYASHGTAFPSSLRWPWAIKWWKPRGHRENLVRAGALIVAEIERLDRAAAREPDHD